MIYENPIVSNEDLVAKLLAAIGNVRGMPDIFASARKSMHHQCESRITVSGRSFEHLL